MALRKRRENSGKCADPAVLAGAASAAAAEVANAPAVEPDPTAGAFFDVDNTMMVGASIFWFARGLAALGCATGGAACSTVTSSASSRGVAA